MSEFSGNWEGGAKGDNTADVSETVHYKFLILGGGTSAGYAARTFAECLGKKNPLGIDIASITNKQLNTSNKKAGALVAIVSAETVAPYERPALSKAYLNPPGSKIQLRLPNFNTCVGSGGEAQSTQWYKDNNIDLLLGHEAIDVDLEKQEVICDRKSDRKLVRVTYDKMVIATGARPLFTSMFEKADILENIFVLRNEVDASSIVKTLEEFHKRGSDKKAKVMIIGGGYIGMECAAAFSGWNVDVMMVFPEDNLLSRVFTSEISGWYEAYLQKERGVKIMKNMKVMKFIGDSGKVEKAQLENGDTVDIDMALIGIGAVLNIDIFQQQLQFAPKSVRGIAVTNRLQTSDANVFAIGDIAAVPYKRGLKRFEHVDHCRRTAEIAVKNLLIDTHNYLSDYKKESQLLRLQIHEYTPFYYSRLFEYTDTPVIFNFYGSNGEDEEVEIVQFGDVESLVPSPIGAFWVDKTGRVVGGLLCCAPKEAFEELKDIVLSRRRMAALTPAGAMHLYTKL